VTTAALSDGPASKAGGGRQPFEQSQPPTRKGRRTRSEVVRAAREVFEDSGYLDAKVADIAKAAGVGHGSFYGYFPSKEAVFAEVAHEVVGEIFEASRSPDADSDDPLAAIQSANSQFLEAWARNRRFLLVLDQVATFNDEFRQLWRDIRNLFVQRAERGLRRLQDQGLADTNLDPHVAAFALGGMVENFARAWLLHNEAFDAQVALDTLTRLWAQAIALKIETGTSR
jgi:AcrR family transcriptional regulator